MLLLAVRVVLLRIVARSSTLSSSIHVFYNLKYYKLVISHYCTYGVPIQRRVLLFVLEVLKAWIDPAQKNPKTIHHLGYSKFVVDGEPIELKSHMR